MALTENRYNDEKESATFGKESVIGANHPLMATITKAIDLADGLMPINILVDHKHSHGGKIRPPLLEVNHECPCEMLE